MKKTSFLKNAIRTKKKLKDKPIRKGGNIKLLSCHNFRMSVKTKENFPSPHFSLEMRKTKRLSKST